MQTKRSGSCSRSPTCTVTSSELASYYSVIFCTIIMLMDSQYSIIDMHCTWFTISLGLMHRTEGTVVGPVLLLGNCECTLLFHTSTRPPYVLHVDDGLPTTFTSVHGYNIQVHVHGYSSYSYCVINCMYMYVLQICLLNSCYMQYNVPALLYT